MKRSLFVLISILVLVVALTTNPSHAQSTASVDWSSASDLQVMLQAIESVPPAPADSLSRGGTFWSAQHAPGAPLAWPPLPGNFNQVPVWGLGSARRPKASARTIGPLTKGL